VRTLVAGYPAGHHLPVHRHEHGQLAYAASGFLTVRADEVSWVVPTDRAAWIPAGARHSLATRVRTRLHSIYLPVASGPGLGAVTTVVHVSPLVRELIAHIVGRGTLDLTVTSDRQLVDVLVDQVRLLDVAALELRSPVDARAREAADLLREDPSRQPSELARAVGTSRRTLERLFRAETDVAFGRWRQRAQVLRAMELLSDGASVTDAGHRVGYATTSAFIAAFRRLTGVTPGRFLDPAPHAPS
jgi:AraC-like DNA-binding protein